MWENATPQWTKLIRTHSHLMILIIQSVLQKNVPTFLFQEVFDYCFHSKFTPHIDANKHWEG